MHVLHEGHDFPIFSLNLLQSKSVSLKRFMVLFEAFAETFLSLSTLDTHLKKVSSLQEVQQKYRVFNTQTETSSWVRRTVCLQYCYAPQRWYSSSSQSQGTLQCHIHVQCHARLQCIVAPTHSPSGDRRCPSDPSAWALCRAVQPWTCVWKYATNTHTWQHFFPWDISKSTAAEKSLQVLKCMSHKNFENWVW